MKFLINIVILFFLITSCSINKVIAPLTIRRTRTDLKIHSQYKIDLDEQGIVFPNIKKPNRLYYKLSPELDQLYDNTMHMLSHETEGIKYFRYQAIKFLKPDKKQRYKIFLSIIDKLNKRYKKIMIINGKI